MPELTSKKVMPTINTFDFDYFADNKGKRIKVKRYQSLRPIVTLNFRWLHIEN